MCLSHVDSVVFLELSKLYDCNGFKMHSTKVHAVINRIFSLFYRIGFWHRGDKPTVRELRIKLIYCIYHSLFAVSLWVGAITSKNYDEQIFLAEAATGVTVLAINFCVMIWKQHRICDLTNRICVFSIRYDEDLTFFNDRLKEFMKFVIAFVVVVFVGFCFETVVIPFFGSEKNHFLKIAFPLDWKNSEIAFWIAAIFVASAAFLSVLAVCFSIIIWYLLLTCSLRHKVLGSEIKKMGQISGEIKGKMSKKQKYFSYFQDLKALIDAHLHLRELINEVESVFSNLFLIKFGTSGLCICGSIYCLAFDIGENVLERLTYSVVMVYFIAELFMITYFGNEIMLLSNCLSYSLFESDWLDQPQSTKKCILIFGEYLKQPQVLVIGKLYSLTLETFTKILKSAYSMFNILKNFQK